MKRTHLIVATIAVLLVVWLFFAVQNDLEQEPDALCAEANGSVCTASAECPDGFEPTNEYTCGTDAMTCCVPV